MDPPTRLLRRAGDTPMQRASHLAKAIGASDLRLKLEGANPTGTQKDRIARLEVATASSRGHKGLTVASCGNFGVAVAHAAFVHELACDVFVPASFQGERVELMENLGAKVHRVEGTYEDAVTASRRHATAESVFDANPGGSSTLRTLAGYSEIAEEIIKQMSGAPAAVAVSIGNGSTLAGVHLGFRTAWAQGRANGMPMMLGGSSSGNNPVVAAFDRGQERCTPLDRLSIKESHVNEPLVNWDALDGTACLTAIQDSEGFAYGFDDERLLELHAALLKDGVDAHPASLSAAAAIARAIESGKVPADAPVVAVMTSGRPEIQVRRIGRPDDMPQFLQTLSDWLGRFDDPLPERTEAVEAAFDRGHVVEAADDQGRLGCAVLTPMELSTFFPKFHLSYIAVHPRARGRGIGTVLLEEALRVSNGDLSLHVETDNEAAIRLYRKFGFQAKYYRMLHKPQRLSGVDPARGAGWEHREQPVNGATPPSKTQ